MFNIKKHLKAKKDQELIVFRSEARTVIRVAERGYSGEGVDPVLATQASDAAEVATVASALIRNRVESGDDYSHKGLQESDAISPKRVDRGWGRYFSSRRRA